MTNDRLKTITSHGITALISIILTILVTIVYFSYANVIPEVATFKVQGHLKDDMAYQVGVRYEKRVSEPEERLKQGCVANIIMDRLENRTTLEMMAGAVWEETISHEKTPHRSAVQEATEKCDMRVLSTSLTMSSHVWAPDQSEI